MTLGRAVIEVGADTSGFKREVADGVDDGLAAASKSASAAVGDSLKNLGAQTTQAGKQVTKGVTLPLVGLGAVALKFSSDFNAAMANVATLIPGNTERVNELKTSVQDLAIETGKSTADLSDGLYQVISAFGDTADSVGILETNARAARAGLASTNDAINLTSAITKAYGDTSAEAVKQVADLALLTVRMGQTTFPELASSMGKVTPIAQSLGQSQEELFAVFSTLTGVTGSAAEVSTQYRGILAGLINPTADLNALLKRQGFESGKAALEQLGLVDTLRLITGEAEKTGKPITKYLASIEAVPAALALAGTQADKFGSALEANQKAAGTTDEAFNEVADGVGAAGFAMDQARQKVSVLLQRLGDGLAPALLAVLDAAEPVLDIILEAATAFANADPAIQGTVVAVAGLVAAVGPMLVILGTLISSIGTIVGAFGALTGGAAAAGAATTAAGGAAAAAGGGFLAAIAPILAVVAAVGAVVAAVVYLWKTNEEFRTAVMELWASISEFITTILDELRAFWMEWGDEILATARVLWSAFSDVVVRAFNIVKAIIEGVLNIVLGLIDVFAGTLTGDWSRVWEGVKQILSGAVKAIGSIVKNLIGVIVDLFKGLGPLIFNAISSAVEGIGTWLVNAGEDLIRGLIEGVGNMAGALVDKVKGVAGDAVGAVTGFLGISSPSKVFTEIGEDVGRGFINGITGTERSVAASAEALAATATRAASDALALMVPRVTGLDPAVMRGALSSAARPLTGPRILLAPEVLTANTRVRGDAAPPQATTTDARVTEQAITINQNNYGPTTSSERIRELDWALRFGTGPAGRR